MAVHNSPMICLREGEGVPVGTIGGEAHHIGQDHHTGGLGLGPGAGHLRGTGRETGADQERETADPILGELGEQRELREQD